MPPHHKTKYYKIAVLAGKIAIGSSLAIWFATLLELQFAASAGIIALLSIVTTKKESLRLIVVRLATYIVSVGFSWVIFQHIKNAWIAYGIFIFLIVAMCEGIGWRSTLSVNAVIGTHFLTTLDFSMDFIRNEFQLFVIGIMIAAILSLFQNNTGHRERIIASIDETEQLLLHIIEKLAAYLSGEESPNQVWDEVNALEHKLQEYIQSAYEYENNSLRPHTDYYAHYFEMRAKQCGVLQNLKNELNKISRMPGQAKYIADYLTYMKSEIFEMKDPEGLLHYLDHLIDMIYEEELPATREEFEQRALLYHVVMDLEEFLLYKRRFLQSIADNMYLQYWKEI